jgi:hypothetical protein
MAAMQAIGVAQQAVSASNQGKASQAYYQFLASQNEKQVPQIQKAANLNTETVVSAAGREETNLNRGASALEGAQKATEAASGVYGGSGTAADVARDTASKVALDRAAIRENANLRTRAIATGAANEVTALKTQADSFRMAGDNAAVAGRTNAISSVLGGATQVASSWYRWRQLYGGSGSGDPLANVYG